MPVRGTAIANPGGIGPGAPITRRLKRDAHVRGIRYALENGARVINSSIGSLIFREDVESLDFCVSGEGQRGIRFVPVDKYNSGLQQLEAEWIEQIGPLADRAVLTSAAGNCRTIGREEPNIDDEGFFFWPAGFGVARPEHGLSFVHRTMIGVSNSIHHKTLPDVLGGGDPTGPEMNSDTVESRATVQIAAPGTGWRLPLGRVYPATGLGMGLTDCGDRLNQFRLCEGTSLAAPLVAGAAALVMSEFPTLDPIAVRQRILDSASRNSFSNNNKVEEGRLLDVAAALAP